MVKDKTRLHLCRTMLTRAAYSCRQTILFDGIFSTVRSLSCGVPQGSMLWPLLFLLYTADLGELGVSLGLSSHFYADDSQLYTWGPPSTVAQQRRRMELGVERIAEWMRSNRLRLKPKKTCGVQPADGVSTLTPLS